MIATTLRTHSKTAKEKGEKLVKSVGYKLENVPFIPVSGWKGDNLVKKSENMAMVYW